MDKDTITLLKECNSGCKMATNSMEQVKPYAEKENLKILLDEYNKKHIAIGDACHQMLNTLGKDEKDPQSMQKMISWASTELKLRVNEDDEKIADMLVDGCNMGIKSLSKNINQNKNASVDSLDLAHKLVKTEQQFQSELLDYL